MENNKFQNAEALEKSYNELQAEFTRKCQRLSQLEKIVANNLVEQVAEGEKSENLEVGSDIAAQELTLDNFQPNSTELANSWKDNADKFFENNALAKQFSNEIAVIITSDDSVRNAVNPFEVAYLRVLERKFQEPSSFTNDENFVKTYILTNEDIKGMIIKDYLATLNRNSKKILPQGRAMSVLPEKPKTIFEAGKMFEKEYKTR